MSREEEEAKELEEARKEREKDAPPNKRLLVMRRAGRPELGEKGHHYHAWILTGQSTDALTFTCVRCKETQAIPALTTSADTEP
ncbi:MAG: hypothetical protein KGI38_12540 [Thaumarchaeota archaeon]|nr:hypothetical protein [Nitrososphaerota archaeon]